MASVVKKHRVCAWQARTKLNELAIVTRAQQGKLEEVPLSESPATAANNFPAGTLSLMRLFKMHGKKGMVLAITHHYRLPDGTTTPHDPKFVRVANEQWIPRPCDSLPCPDCHKWQQQARRSLADTNR